MKKSNVPAKSKGVLIFAFNTDVIIYVTIAEHTARLAQHTLNLPVTLVTETGTQTTYNFDQIIYVDNILENYKPTKNAVYQWRNGDRYKAYELSPYDETLLIDSDYLILDTSLLKLFSQTFDYRIMTYNQKPGKAWDERMGIYSLQYQWATVILFRKTVRSQMLFELAGRVQRNYSYYFNLYHLSRGTFRNDFAFTIANNILNGYDQGMNQGIPWPMLTLSEPVDSLSLKDRLIVIKETDKAYVVPRQNLHIMNKEYLLSDNFSTFVEQVCAE